MERWCTEQGMDNPRTHIIHDITPGTEAPPQERPVTLIADSAPLLTLVYNLHKEGIPCTYDGVSHRRREKGECTLDQLAEYYRSKGDRVPAPYLTPNELTVLAWVGGKVRVLNKAPLATQSQRYVATTLLVLKGLLVRNGRIGWKPEAPKKPAPSVSPKTSAPKAATKPAWLRTKITEALTMAQPYALSVIQINKCVHRARAVVLTELRAMQREGQVTVEGKLWSLTVASPTRDPKGEPVMTKTECNVLNLITKQPSSVAVLGVCGNDYLSAVQSLTEKGTIVVTSGVCHLPGVVLPTPTKNDLVAYLSTLGEKGSTVEGMASHFGTHPHIIGTRLGAAVSNKEVRRDGKLYVSHVTLVAPSVTTTEPSVQTEPEEEPPVVYDAPSPVTPSPVEEEGFVSRMFFRLLSYIWSLARGRYRKPCCHPSPLSPGSFSPSLRQAVQG